LSSSAQGSAFTYQGRLNEGASPATGTYDLRFTIFDFLSGGNALGGPVTNAGTVVSNGLFAVTLDFGVGVFSGPARWLEIGVRTNAGGAFTSLAPRQPLTPSPYAIYAGGVNASGIAGTISAGNIANGTITSNMLAAVAVCGARL